MRFALISDVHLGPAASHQGKLRKLTHLSEDLINAFVRRMRDEVNPDLVINLGDVIEDESADKDRERYGHFVAMLREIGKPVLHVAGNHDTINLAPTELCAMWGNSAEPTYSQDHGGVHFAVLRTIEHRGERIELPATQIAWLEQDLAKTALPSIVLMHHPASEMRLEGNRWFEKRPNLCRVAERRPLREVIQKSGKVLATINSSGPIDRFEVQNRQGAALCRGLAGASNHIRNVDFCSATIPGGTQYRIVAAGRAREFLQYVVTTQAIQ